MDYRNQVGKMGRSGIRYSGLGSFRRRQSGVVAVLVGGILMVLIFFAALAIDIGYAMVTKNELQNVADGAALAGARMLGRIYECNGDVVGCAAPMPYENQQTYTADESMIKTASQEVGLANSAGGKNGITINGADIVIGRWDPVNRKIDPATVTSPVISPDAVQVTAKRNSSANGPIRTFLAGVMGIATLDISAVATAALTGSSSIGPGGLPLPVAINKSWMSTVPCNENLTLHPSSAGVCAAWHSYTNPPRAYFPTNAANERQLLDDLAALSFTSPETIAGETQFEFTNGTLAAVFTHDNIQNLFNTMKVINEGPLDSDTDSTTWTTSVPIFDDTEGGGTLCNPNGAITIVGFATIVITNVTPPDETTIYAKVACNAVNPGRGGGGYYGTKGTIPGLVQ